ncbi:molybdopterin-binding protein [Tannockella kyphosi]|uniref:molybdopterin-binding protein n=1 Tax=Tannockella kyphosi TaxID=2899121 RepID=UPI00201234CE|nr:molybdopterin-binding protein [Tannockella kyphosi]
MIVEIINVGTELLLGEIVNTNATMIQKMCKELGFDIYHQSVVGDNPQRILECFDIAFQRGANCIITTGGLGPTTDDLTKELSAQYLGLEMVCIKEEAKKVEDKCLFVTGWDKIPENNLKQANFPKNAYILENHIGTANGCVMKKDQKMIINLPGPPKELQFVIEDTLKPYLEQYREAIIYTYDFITMNIGESKIDEVLADIIDQQDKVSIALYAGEQSVRIRLGCKALSSQQANQEMEATKTVIEERLGKYIIRQKNLKEALYQIMPCYHIDHISYFQLPESIIFGPTYDKSSEFVITVDSKKHKLGDILTITLNDGIETIQFELCLLKDAILSIAKIEAKMTEKIYTFLKNKR